MDMKLKDKLALVSGSTAGIGYAIATALAGEGARVVINGRSPASVEDTVAKVRAATGGHVHGFAGDLISAAAAEEVVRRHPDIAILVNNLGMFKPKPEVASLVTYIASPLASATTGAALRVDGGVVKSAF